jgi:DNA topoisomerase-1
MYIFKNKSIILINYMSYKLVIVESPAKCQKIEKFLGSGYKVLGSFGHITHLSNLKQIDFENNYKPSFEIISSKNSQINKLREAIKKSSEVILATDDDREGEAIAWHITQVFKLNPETTKRILFHEITERAIKNAIANPGLINMSLVYAQQGRQILDLIVGFKITPLLWKHIVANTKNSLSAGRCQSPALRLVYDNYKEIQESPGKLSFNTSGYFTSKNIAFNLNINHSSHKEIKTFLELSKSFNHVLSREKEKEIKKNPPQPFTTSGLQQASNNLMHISPKETMALAQKLYESGYITYMRTDSKVYSEEFIEKSKQYIIKNYNDSYINPLISHITQKMNDEGENTEENNEKDSKKKSKKTTKKSKKDDAPLAQEAHEAIRPTNICMENIPQDEDVFTGRHRKLYRLIWSNTLESLMSPAVYKQLVIKISAPENNYYKYSAEENIFPGWKTVNGVEEDKYYKFLSTIKEGSIEPKKIFSKQTLKDLKSHYSEARLVQLLEQRGIGRPSTFSSLIDKIQERDYVKKQNVEGKKLPIIDYCLENGKINEEKGEKEFGNEKNKLVITQTGVFVIEFLIKYFNELFNYDYTKNMEDDLDKIAKGNKYYYELCDECNKFIEELVTTNSLISQTNDSKIEKMNIKIDAKHTYLIGRNGPTIKYTKEDGTTGFYGVKNDINIEKLKNGEYKLDEIIETKEDNNKLLGSFKDNNVYLKYGKFGYYLEWGEVKKSLKYVKINVPIKNIELDDAINVLQNAESSDNSLVRKIDDKLAIRKGKYGDYIFYKTEKMKRPLFFKLNGFDEDYKTCAIERLRAWIKEKHEV